jgi:hypothetical protein
MIRLDRQMTLVRLVTQWQNLAPTLDWLGLDYGCGGQRRLDSAVAEAGFGSRGQDRRTRTRAGGRRGRQPFPRSD